MKISNKNYVWLGIIMIVAVFTISGCSQKTETASEITVPAEPETSGETTIPSDAGISTETDTIETTTATTPSETAVKEVNIDMFEWGFTQDPVTINKGDHVRLVVTSSKGTHGIMVPSLGLSSGKVAVGQEQVLEFEATETGPIEYFCNVPCGKGHKSMRGQLVVE